MAGWQKEKSEKEKSENFCLKIVKACYPPHLKAKLKLLWNQFELICHELKTESALIVCIYTTNQTLQDSLHNLEAYDTNI